MKMPHKLGTLRLAAMIIGAVLLVSCSGATSPPATLETTETTSKDTKPYGSITIAGNLGTGSLDPQVNSEALGAMHGAFLDSLVFRLGHAEFSPGIAERWEIAPDGKSYTFYIRKGVKFHDGSDLTGADVKFSLERMIAPESIISASTMWRGAVSKIELKDDYTVVLNFKTPQYEPLTGFAGSITAVLPKKYIEEKGIDYWNKNPIGSGPWRVVSYEYGSRLELEAVVENHWRTVPKFKNVRVLSVPEEATRVAMIRTGELDLAIVGPDSAAGLKTAGFRMLTFPEQSMFWGYFLYNFDNPEKSPLGDKRVRKALALSVNGPEMAEKLFRGYAKPGVLYPILPTAPFFDRNRLKPLPYDPEGAKRLLGEAGHPNGFDMRIIDLVGGHVTVLNQALSGYFRKIGVAATLESMDRAAWNPLTRPKVQPAAWNTLQATMSSATAVDFIRVVGIFHSTEAGTPRHNNKALDEIIDKVLATADPVQRNRLATDALVMARDEYCCPGFLNADLILAASQKVGEMAAADVSAGIAGIQLETITHAK